MSVLKLTPDKMSAFMRIIKATLADTYAAHPDYPKLTVSQLQSFVKRFLGHWVRENNETKQDGTN